MEFSDALDFLCKDSLEDFINAVEEKPVLLTAQNKKGYILYQIACILGKKDFVKFMYEKSKYFNEIIDREISFF